MGPGDLEKALCGLEIPLDPNVLAGVKGSEDAGVYKLNDTIALVLTIDFFTPIVDDPKIFGKAAAANSLSDVYAMGGRPVTAMNVVSFPVKKLGIDVLRSILEGGLEILKQAGVALVGGHSVEDAEPKYGLSVTGVVHPDIIMTNSALKPGDRLILTKAVGTGIIATALKAELASEPSVEAMVNSLCSLNKVASEVAVRFGVRACTDVTGFGLAGHLVEMARAGKCRIRIDSRAVPILEGAVDGASDGLIPGGAYSNREFFGSWINMDKSIPAAVGDLMFDPQTSGGLILGVPPAQAAKVLDALSKEGVSPVAEIGEVLEAHEEGHLEIL
jgi:selenide, water dikinase